MELVELTKNMDNVTANILEYPGDDSCRSSNNLGLLVGEPFHYLLLINKKYVCIHVAL